MPQIKIKGLDINEVCTMSKPLVDELEALIQCPRSYLTVEHIPTNYIFEGQIIKGTPFIEVAWFDRGEEMQDQVAKIITNQAAALGYSAVDVVFTIFEEKRYYENGQHF